MTPAIRRSLAEAAAVAVVSSHNWLSNRGIPNALYVPANVTVAATLVGIARWGGASTRDLGLEVESLRNGVAVGGAAGAVAAAGTVAAAVAPATRRWFADDRALNLTPSAAGYEALVRIPLGTALAEELTFRSALLGLSLQRRSWPASVAWSSVLFGLWHVLPTIDTLPKHAVGRAAVAAGRQRHAVAVAVAATTSGGAALAALRQVTRSVATPVVVHAAVNATALLIARRFGRTGYENSSAR